MQKKRSERKPFSQRPLRSSIIPSSLLGKMAQITESWLWMPEVVTIPIYTTDVTMLIYCIYYILRINFNSLFITFKLWFFVLIPVSKENWQTPQGIFCNQNFLHNQSVSLLPVMLNLWVILENMYSQTVLCFTLISCITTFTSSLCSFNRHVWLCLANKCNDLIYSGIFLILVD